MFGLAVQLAGPVLVLLKDLDGHGGVLVFDHAADLDVVDGAQQRAFAADLALREVELVHGPRQAVGAVARVEAALGGPGVFEALVDGDALFDVDGQHAVDEVESRVADAVPVGRGVVEAAHLDLLGEIEWVVGRVEFVREGREAAETDVQDDSHRPDIDRAGIFAVFAVFENLRSNVYEWG